MRTKRINKNIKDKIEDWLKTINDDQLTDELKEDIIVTGGCIPSLFLNETVNDYDIYLKSDRCINKLLMYYTVINQNKNTQSIFSFMNSVETTIVTEENLRPNKDRKYEVCFVTPNAITFSNKIQVITRFVGTPEEIHKNFDFLHAQNYWTFEDGLVTNTNSLECILTKELLYSGSLYPLSSIIRTRKFIQRGWYINAGQYLKMGVQLSKIDLYDIETLKEQCIGVDMSQFVELLKELKEEMNLPKDEISLSKINELVDKVF